MHDCDEHYEIKKNIQHLSAVLPTMHHWFLRVRSPLIVIQANHTHIQHSLLPQIKDQSIKGIFFVQDLLKTYLHLPLMMFLSHHHNMLYPFLFQIF